MNYQNKQLVDYLRAEGVLKTTALISAFYEIDRLDFVPPQYQSNAYGDFPVDIGFGQTISQPTTVAFMLELLELKAGNQVLDVGSGSGYTTAIIAKAVGAKGKVIGLDVIKDIVHFGRENIGKYKLKNAEILLAEKGIVGMPGKEFDKILVSAAADALPKELLVQLKNKGRLVIPIKDSVWLYEKDNQGKIFNRQFYGFAFVPLI